MGKAARRRTADRLAASAGTDAARSLATGAGRWRGSSRRPDTRSGRGRSGATVPFVARPFLGLPGETDWVALREIVPAATARVRFAGGGGGATVATVLPMVAAGLRRADGEVLVGLQSVGASGDASRDVAAALLAARDLPSGGVLTAAPRVTGETPRLQDLLDMSAPFEVALHEGFDFWTSPGSLAAGDIDTGDLDAGDLDAGDLDAGDLDAGDLDAGPSTPTVDSQRVALERANATVVPTARLESVPSAYWCRIGERAHLRWVLPHDEDAATDALARLHAAGASSLGASTLGATSRLLGAFRACGLLVPVWDLDPGRRAEDYERPVAELAARLGEALASGAALTGDERRARAGLLTRQITLR